MRIRILVSDLPQLLCDAVRRLILAQSDMELLGDVATAEELSAAVAGGGVDVVIVGLSFATRAGDRDPLLYAAPRLRMLGIAHDGRRAGLYRLRPHMTELGEVSRDELLKAIRST